MVDNRNGFFCFEPSSIFIKNSTIVNHDGIKEGNILIENGIISDIFKGALRRKVDLEIDAKGKLVLPGAIDIHFHIREPGEPYNETIYTGTLSAAKGGITSLFMMPNTDPPIDNPQMVAFVRSRAMQNSFVRLFPVGCATFRREGKRISEYGLMKREGIIAVSDDGRAISSSFVLRKSLEYSKNFGLILIEHPEDSELSGDANEGVLTLKYGLTPYPSVAESVCVARDILLAIYVEGKLHLTHLSSAESLELLMFAKEKVKRDQSKAQITSDVTPHHLLLSDEDFSVKDTNFKVNPPLRSRKDVQSLLEGVAEGLIDCIASDHAPHPDFRKLTDFPSSPFGISQADFFVSLCFILVRREIIKIEKMVELISFNPAKIFGLNGGEIKEGRWGDLIIFDPDREFTVREEDIVSRGRNCPYIGWNLKGMVEKTIVAGKLIYDAEIFQGRKREVFP